jgi:S1-C subfamily serine protease
MKRQTKLPPAVVQVTWPNNRRARGLGFVASGEYVVTAAHNLPPPPNFTKGVYNYDPLVVETSTGETLEMWPVFVDPCADLAVLAISDEGLEAGESLNEVVPLQIAWRPTVGSHSGTVGTHDRGIVKVVYDVRTTSTRITFTGKAPFEGGTSGGPVLDQKGRAMAVVSQTTSADGHRQGWGPALGECLPTWLREKIARYEEASEVMPTKPRPQKKIQKVRRPRTSRR